MSGHSKWANIKHKKEKTDAARGKVFTKIGKEITIAVKEGGGDPASNSKLRDLIQKAKANNVPNDNIERCIKKALGSTGETYEEVSYEGYGPAGIAVLVTATTDNRNRTAGNVRAYFSKYHGNMGQTGCVGYLFTDIGEIVVDNEDGDVDEDKLMETALEAGHVVILFELFDQEVHELDVVLVLKRHTCGRALGLFRRQDLIPRLCKILLNGVHIVRLGGDDEHVAHHAVLDRGAGAAGADDVGIAEIEAIIHQDGLKGHRAVDLAHAGHAEGDAVLDVQRVRAADDIVALAALAIALVVILSLAGEIAGHFAAFELRQDQHLDGDGLGQREGRADDEQSGSEQSKQFLHG